MEARADGAMTPLALSRSRYLVRRRPATLGVALPAPSLGGYAPDQVAFAARAWTMKAEEEHFSAAIFADALSYLVDAEVPLDLLGGLHRVVGDELRHVELCLDLARRFEAPTPTARHLPRHQVPSAPDERRARGRSILLVEGAIGETLSSALFATGRRVAEEPCIRAALGLILRDEVLHARFFWEALAALEPGERDKEALHREASAALGMIETTQVLPVLRRLEQGARFEPAWAALGVIPPEERVETYYQAIEGRVIPRLDRLGLDGATAWDKRYAAAPLPRR
jgi:hypothetical protein